MVARRFLTLGAAVALLIGGAPAAAFAENAAAIEGVSPAEEQLPEEGASADGAPEAPAEPAPEPAPESAPEQPADPPPVEAAPEAPAPEEPSEAPARSESAPDLTDPDATEPGPAGPAPSPRGFSVGPVITAAAGADHAVIRFDGPGSDIVGTATVAPGDWVAGDRVVVTVTLLEPPTSVSSPESGITYYYGAHSIQISGIEFGQPWVTSPQLENLDGTVEWATQGSPIAGEKLPTGSYRFEGTAYHDRGANGSLGPSGGISVVRPGNAVGVGQIYGGGGFEWGAALNDPVAAFEYASDAADPKTVVFTNTSTDAEDGPSAMTASWNFGDGETSAEWSPTHHYDQPGLYTVTLTVTDTSNRSDVVSREIRVGAGLVVNSTGDLPATDPGAGCDTGGTVGEGGNSKPECTLRAAIEAANATGGGEIGFDIDGTPVIPLDSALPAVTTPTTIDGTTQSGDWVEVSGGGDAVLTLGGPGSEVRGLALHGAERGIAASAGEHRLSGVRLGLDLEGAPTGDTALGLGVTGGRATLDDSATAATVGVVATAPVEVRDSRIGVDGAGAAVVGSRAGIVAAGPDASISGSTIHGETAGVLLFGGAAAGAEVADNRIGVEGSGIGVSVQGAPGARIVGNTISARGYAGVLVSGSNQTTESGGDIELNDPDEDPAPGAVTGGSTVIEGNAISGEDLLAGIWAWAETSGVQVAENTVSVASRAAILLDGGSGHRVTANLLGSQDAPLAGDGVSAADTGTVAIERNTVHASRYGVRATGGPATVSANAVTGSGDAGIGISVEAEQAGTAVAGNTVRAAILGGILVDAPAATVSGNTVVESGNGIVASGAGLAISGNLVGVTSPTGAVAGNSGTGIRLRSGDASIRDNAVAGSGGDGISVDAAAKGTLRANRIWETVGSPIDARDAAPLLAAALISDTETTSRTTLLVSGIPDGPAGTLEVFANDSCGVDGGEAQHVTGITRQTKPGRTSQIVQFQSSRDHFTLVYTSADGSSTRLSLCQDRATHPDADGDGSPDPLDGLLDGSDDPTIAVIATANEQLLVAAVADRDDAAGIGGGALENLRVVDDPAPGSHPSGWTLPYGTLSFRVAGIAPGATTLVSLTTFFADDPLQGNAYWKHGSPTPGAAATWYDFAHDAATGTGAQRSSANVPGLGFRTVYLLTLTDGVRGDEDGAMNGSITDPGGPVAFAGGSIPGATPSRPVSGLSTTGSSGVAGQAMLWAAAAAILVGASMLRRRRGRVRLR